MNSDITKIQNVKFVKGIIGTDDIFLSDVPQYAFVGRSNVGKSSVINMVLGRRIAYPSSTPGKTSEINFFSVNNESLYVVDLPGYGFAKVSAKEQEKFRKRIIWYLSESGAKPIRIFLILDARRGLTDMDKDMIDIMKSENHPFVMVVNKIDKLTQSEQSLLQKELAKEMELIGVSNTKIILCSVKTERGKDVIFKYIF